MWSGPFAAQLSVYCTFFKIFLFFLLFVRFGCVCTEIYFLMFTDRFDMDIAQFVEVATTPSPAGIGDEAVGSSDFRGKQFSWHRPVSVSWRICYGTQIATLWSITKNLRDWSHLSISLSNAFRSSRACWTKIQDGWPKVRLVITNQW